MTTQALQESEFHPYYAAYIARVDPASELMDALKEGGRKTEAFYQNLPEEKHEYRYAEGKWTCKEVLQHLIDTERIFLYRAFRISRGDQTPLAGFDQNDYVPASGANKKSMETLLEEYRTTRIFTLSVLGSLSTADLGRMGSVNGNLVSARAAAFIIAGHEIWHNGIIEERYL
ncbi:DinB family protein [Aureicoccus marinus]|uniref:DinB-like domain-containing protein n=1 Tax=Aureicoccus marinus TaxID=754435 RepID=A0A2S7T7V1_9FLAO|nr:DinB family protein [Aureicoccus marinus]PQJ16000.1 hypothetical protein BST99_09935 [Aureicoccus marinus]